MAKPIHLVRTDDLHPHWPFPMAVKVDGTSAANTTGNEGAKRPRPIDTVRTDGQKPACTQPSEALGGSGHVGGESPATKRRR